MTERIAYADDEIERRRFEVVGQIIPSSCQCPQRDAVLVGELLRPTHHARAGVGSDHIETETGKTDRELAGPA